MGHKKLRNVLPKLVWIMAKDFIDFRSEWKDVLRAHTEVVKWLKEVRRWNSEYIEEGAVQIIEEYIKNRREGAIGNKLFPAYTWLASELGQMFYEIAYAIMEEIEGKIYNPDRDEDEEGHPIDLL
jgi:hypothetical protein